MLEGVPISSGGQQAHHPNAEPHHRLHSAEDPHEKAPPGAGLSSLRGLAEMRVNGKPTDTISQKAPPGSGAKFGRSIVMGLPGRWQTQHSTPTRSVGFCVESPTQHRLHTARIKKAPPAGGAKGLILMHR